MSANANLIAFFQGLRAEAVAKNEVYRARAFDQTIKSLSALSEPITLETIPATIGKSNRTKIEKFLRGEVVIQVADPERDRVVQLFQTIPGVGPKTAQIYYDKGYRTIDDVRINESFTYRQSIGLKYYEDLQERIPRSEIQLLEQKLITAISQFNQINGNNLTFVIAGSYRREAPDSGDIDVLLVDLNGLASQSIDQLIRFLQDRRILYETLSLGKVKYNGITRVLEKYRRLDIEIIDDLGALPTALIYFTGSKDLNIHLRQKAQERGWLLNTNGLYVNGNRLGLQTEGDVFAVLEEPYLAPSERN